MASGTKAIATAIPNHKGIERCINVEEIKVKGLERSRREGEGPLRMSARICERGHHFKRSRQKVPRLFQGKGMSPRSSN